MKESGRSTRLNRKTYKWSISFGCCPVEVWQYASSPNKAREMILQKLENLKVKGECVQDKTFYQKEGMFGTIFIGYFTVGWGDNFKGRWAEMFKNIEEREPSEIFDGNRGSGFTSCLDG